MTRDPPGQRPNSRRDREPPPAVCPATGCAARLLHRGCETRAGLSATESRRLPKVDLQAFVHAPRRDVGQYFPVIAVVDGAAVEQVVDVAQPVLRLRTLGRMQRFSIRKDPHAGHDRIPGKYRITFAQRPLAHRCRDSLSGHPKTQKLLQSLWMSGKGISAPVRQRALGKGYPVFSWYSIMSGMGIFPDRESLHPPKGTEAQYRLGDIDNLLDRSTVNYRDHREVLANIPPRRMDESLQVYFW